MENDKTIVENPSESKYNALSLFTLEFNSIHINSVVHLGNREQSDERFFKYIRDIDDSLSVDSISSPFYVIYRYLFDFEGTKQFISDLGIEKWNKNDQESNGIKLRNYIQTAGFHPEDKIYLRDAGFTLALKPEISNFDELKSNLKEISKILGNVHINSVTSEMLKVDRDILSSKMQPVIKEKNKAVDARQDKEQKTDPGRIIKRKPSGKLKM